LFLNQSPVTVMTLTPTTLMMPMTTVFTFYVIMFAGESTVCKVQQTFAFNLQLRGRH